LLQAAAAFLAGALLVKLLRQKKGESILIAGNGPLKRAIFLLAALF